MHQADALLGFSQISFFLDERLRVYRDLSALLTVDLAGFIAVWGLPHQYVFAQ